MNIDQLRSVYFLGIGGIGMSALARYFRGLGIRISGYDRSSTPLTDQLAAEGMNIHFEENITLIPDDTDLVVYTPAMPKDHKELAYLLGKNVPVKKRAEVLGMIAGKGHTIAVAGTHGKTTTSTLIAHIFKSSDTDMMAFLGGISKNYGTNFLNSSVHQLINSSTIVVAEADEYDRSFLHLHPAIAVITSADADHLDIYGNLGDMTETFRAFTRNILPGGSLIIKKGVAIDPGRVGEIRVLTYSIEENADYTCSDLRVNYGTYHFDLRTPGGTLKDLTVGIPGHFNLENAIAAIAVAHQSGISEDHIRTATETYKGVQRRFDLHIRREDFVYLDDYAHHPEELKACIGAVREVYPGKKITGVFQPHLFSRTRDFADAFARSLEMLDEIILLDIYPAREKPIDGVDSAMLLDRISSEHKSLCIKGNLIAELKRIKPEVLLTLGAGDIDQFVPLIIKAFTV
jgi:UDP-N-acetylmuramate--alanine ligase